MSKPLARPLQPVAQQMLAEAGALLLAEDAAEMGWVEKAQGGSVLHSMISKVAFSAVARSFDEL